MATTSSIAVQRENGTVAQIYCHWDGYPEHNGKLLEEHYNTLEKAEALIKLGALSFLDKSIECPAGHTFRSPVEGYSIAYGRDRGETGVSARVFASITEYKRRGRRENYNYLFRDGKWEIV